MPDVTEEMPDVTGEMQAVYDGDDDDDARTENLEDLDDKSCASCHALKGENRKLRNQVKSLQCKLKEKRKNLRKTRTEGVYSQVKFIFAFLSFEMVRANWK